MVKLDSEMGYIINKSAHNDQGQVSLFTVLSDKNSTMLERTHSAGSTLRYGSAFAS